MRAEYGVAGTAGLRVDYDPFGQPEAGAGLGAPADYGFTGEPRDSTTGLVQLRARWYAPGKGQFASRDPFAGLDDAPQSFNQYAYAHNDPANLADPTGRSPLEEPGFGAGDAGGSLDAALAAVRGLAAGGMAGACAEATGRTLLVPARPEEVAGTAAAVAGYAQAVSPGALVVVGGAMVAAGGAAAGATGAATACLATVVCPVAITIGVITLAVIVYAVAAPPPAAAPAPPPSAPARPAPTPARPTPAPPPTPATPPTPSTGPTPPPVPPPVPTPTPPKADDACRRIGAWGPAQGGGADPQTQKRARDYQVQIAGVDASWGFYVRGTMREFDGCREGVLLEAKGPGYDTIWGRGWGRASVVDQGRWQQGVARTIGAPLVWAVAEEAAAAILKGWFVQESILYPQVIHVPPLR